MDGQGARLRAWAVLGGLLLWLGLAAGELATSGSTWIFSWALELGVAAAVLLSAWAAGRLLLGAIWPAGAERGGARFIELALGLGAIGVVVLALGLAGALGRVAIGAGLLLGTVTGLRELAPRVRAFVERDPGPGERGRRIETLLVIAPLACAFAWAAMPPTFYDAVVYHLGLPNLYLASGRLEYPPAFSLAGYPQYAELILLPALAAGNETAARITSFLICALAALAVRAIVRERLGRSAGNVSYALLVTQWFFCFQAVFLKLDVAGAFFVLTALWALVEAREEDGARPWIVAGLLAGLALGVKLTNVLPVAAAAALSPWLHRSFRARALGRAALLLVLAVAVVSPWLVRNAVHRGNPLFPAFYEVLGGTGWQPHNAARMRAETGMELDRSPRGAARRVARIGRRGGHGSGGELSPVWVPLLLVGLAVPAPRELRFVLACAAISLVVGVACFTSYLRVFAFALVATAIAPGLLWSAVRSSLARGAIGLGGAVVVLLGIASSARLTEIVSAGGSRVILGRIGPRAYAEEQLGYLPLARYINDTLPPGARIRLVGTARSAYIHRTCIADYAWDDAWAARLVGPGADMERLRQELSEDGFTHVLLDPLEMERLERSSGLFGYAGSDAARERIDRFFRSLPLEASANGVYLFRVAR